MENYDFELDRNILLDTVALKKLLKEERYNITSTDQLFTDAFNFEGYNPEGYYFNADIILVGDLKKEQSFLEYAKESIEHSVDDFKESLHFMSKPWKEHSEKVQNMFDYYKC